MKTQHEDQKQEDWHFAKILENLPQTESSLLRVRTFDSNTLLHVAANSGHVQSLQTVEVILSLQHCQELLTAKNSSGDLPLHVAANAGHLSIVQRLVSSPQCQELLMAKNSNGDIPLHVAANAGHLPIVQQLVRSSYQCEELLMAQNSNGDLPLHVAANAGHLYIVQHLVKSSYQCLELLTEKNFSDDMPLPLPLPPEDVNAGYQRLVKLSYQQLQDRYTSKLLRVKNKEGNTPLHLALIKKYEEVDLNLKTKYHEVVKFLIEKDPDACTDLNKANKDPLDMAIKAQDDELQQLMSSDHYQLSQDAFGGDAKMEIKRECKNSVIPELDRVPHKSSDRYQNSRDAFWGAAKMEMEREAMKSIIPELERVPNKSKPAIKQEAAFSEMVMQEERFGMEDDGEVVPEPIIPHIHKPEDKVTSMDGALYKAVKSQDFNFIKKRAQDPEHPALSDKTPELNTILHLAAASSNDNHQFVQEILEIKLCQKFVTEKNSNGDLPLHVAASTGNKQIVELLVEWSNKQLQDHCNCVPLVETNLEKNTPLHLALIKKFQVGRNSASKAKYNEVATFLVEKCPVVSFYYPNKERKSPLYLAAEAGDAELVKLMIDTVHRLPCGKSIVHAAIYYLMTITNLQYGRSIVHAAIYGSFTARKLRCLNTHSASFLCPSMCLNTHTDILDTVLKSLPDDIVTEKDDKGMTPLFYAASIGYLDGVEILLKNPTKCCAYDERATDGYYPIHIASRKGHIQVIKKFLDKYPDMIELLNGEGQNIIHVAAMYGKANIVAHMLKSHDPKVEMLINNEDQNGNTPLHLAAKKGHPRVVSILTWDERVDSKALNKEGKRALDIVLNDSGKNFSFGERLTWEALRYVSGPRENSQSSEVRKKLNTDKYNERTGTLLLVATLVATVTFAAAFTMPGGYDGPGGVATFLEKPMFQVFIISNTIAMYSAITAVIALIWAHLGDHKLLIAAYKLSLPMLGLAITMVSLAFMVGNYLVLRDLNWLAYLVLSIGSFFLFTLSIIFFPLFLPNSSPHPIIRDLLHYPFHLLIIVTTC